METDEFVAHAPLGAEVLEAWIEAGWLLARQDGAKRNFFAVDLARAHLIHDLAVCGKTGKFELLPFRYGALCWWFSRLARHKGSFSFLYGVRLCGNQFRDADQIVGDEVQQESSGDTSNPAMLSLAHRAMLLAPAKDAFDHFAALLRHAIARVPCRAGIDRASPPLADFGRAIVLRHMRRDVDGTQVFNMALRIIGLVRACRDAMTNGLALGFQHGLRGAPFR